MLKNPLPPSFPVFCRSYLLFPPTLPLRIPISLGFWQNSRFFPPPNHSHAQSHVPLPDILFQKKDLSERFLYFFFFKLFSSFSIRPPAHSVNNHFTLSYRPRIHFVFWTSCYLLFLFFFFFLYSINFPPCFQPRAWF